MASNQDGGPTGAETALAGDCGSDVMGGQRGRSGGCHLASQQPGSLAGSHVARRKATGRSQPRMISCFARGLILIVGTLIRGEGLLLGRFVPEPWPCAPPALRKFNSKRNAHQPAMEAAS